MKTVICVDKDKNTYEVPISDLTWRPSVYAVIITNVVSEDELPKK